MDVPVTISGGGIIGSYISLRLQRSNINSIVIEKSEDTVSSSEGIRTLTLNPHSMAMLNNIGVSLESAAIKEIIVLDGEGTGKIQFSEKEIDSKNLSYVVMFNDLRNELLALSKDKTIFNNEIQSIQNLNSEDDPEVILKDDTVIKTKIVAGCDGRNSKVASIASLKSSYNEYMQTALTFTVEAKQSETKNAYQVFSEKGIFALMPMPKKDLDQNRWTIVWSVSDSELKNQEVSSYVEDNLCYFESKLGINMTVSSEILSFRLSNHHFDEYIKGPVVLLGDAAHSIHPLAGQGINLGFADADVFCEEIIQAHEKGFVINEKSILKRYEIRRKGMNLLMLKSMDFFVNFFNTDNLYLRLIRNWGLNTVNKTKFIKAFFIKHASGLNKV